MKEVEDVKDSEDSSEILALNNPEKTVIKQEKQSEKAIVEKVSPKEKTISYKDDVVQIIEEKFSDRISIEAKGKKFIISRKTENDLFANA